MSRISARIRTRPVAAVMAMGLTLLFAGTSLATAWSHQIELSFGGLAALQSGHVTAAAGSTVHVLAWVDSSVGYKHSLNAGNTYAPAVTIAAKTASITYDPAAIAAAPSHLVVAVYASSGPGNARGLWMRRSTDNGAHWKAPQKVAGYTSSDNSMGYADVAVSGSHVYIAWTDRTSGNVLLRQSTDGGASLKASETIGTTANPFIAGKDGDVTVAAAGNNAYVAWVPGANTGVVLRRSANSGTTWSPKQTIATAKVGYHAPSASAAGATVLISYNLNTGAAEVARSTNSGAAFSSSTVSPASAFVYATDVTISGTKAGISFFDDQGNVTVRESSNGGGTWGPKSAAAPFGDTPNINVANGRRIVVFNISSDFSVQVDSVHD